MCGNFGMAGDGITRQDLVVLKDLALMLAPIRGMDGTGIYEAEAFKGKLVYSRLFKSKWDSHMAFGILETRKKDKLLENTRCNVFIGHVRSATIGDVSDNNAHPFETKSFVGCHNGTLRGWEWHSKTQTDSELMFEEMEKQGIKEVLSSLDRNDAFAVVVYDKVQNRLYFARNKERPLWFALHRERDVLYWCSERGALHWALERRGIQTKDVITGYFKEDRLLYCDPENITKGVEAMWHIEEIVYKKKFNHIYPSRGFQPINQNTTPPVEEKKKEEKRERDAKTRVLEEPKSNILPLFSKKDDKKDVILETECVLCKKHMNLIDMHKGMQIGINQWECYTCLEEVTAQQAKTKDQVILH